MRTPRNFLEEVPVKSEELLNALNNRVVSRVILQSVELEGSLLLLVFIYSFFIGFF
jgi:hypothetical protein